VKICGLMKTTLLDFPKRLACTVFLGRCNLRCPFCHNSKLAFETSGDEISEEEFFKFLEKRKGLLDGVCISGGEPLMHEEVFVFIKKVKSFGYLVKLDTNGCFPERLEKALEMVDYVAMDIKNSLPRYGIAVGICDFGTENIKKSIEILKKSGVEHEFRTTLVKGIHTKEDVIEMAKMVAGEKNYFLQSFKMSDNVPDKALAEFTKDEMENLLKKVREYVPDADLRGI